MIDVITASHNLQNVCICQYIQNCAGGACIGCKVFTCTAVDQCDIAMLPTVRLWCDPQDDSSGSHRNERLTIRSGVSSTLGYARSCTLQRKLMSSETTIAAGELRRRKVIQNALCACGCWYWKPSCQKGTAFEHVSHDKLETLHVLRYEPPTVTPLGISSHVHCSGGQPQAPTPKNHVRPV